MVVSIGVYFMDLKLGEAVKEGKREQHVKWSVEVARNFFKEHSVSKENEAKILNCIAAHHHDVPFTCLEAEICANADCYRFIHPRGFFAFLGLQGQRSKSFDEVLNRVEEKMDEKHKILSLEICKQELEPYYHTLKQYIKEARSSLN